MRGKNIKGPMGRRLQPTYPLSLTLLQPELCKSCPGNHPLSSSPAGAQLSLPAGSGPGFCVTQLCRLGLVETEPGTKLAAWGRFGDSQNKVLQMPTLGLAVRAVDLRPPPLAFTLAARCWETEAYSLNSTLSESTALGPRSLSQPVTKPLSAGAPKYNQLVSPITSPSSPSAPNYQVLEENRSAPPPVSPVNHTDDCVLGTVLTSKPYPRLLHQALPGSSRPLACGWAQLSHQQNMSRANYLMRTPYFVMSQLMKEQPNLPLIWSWERNLALQQREQSGRDSMKAPASPAPGSLARPHRSSPSRGLSSCHPWARCSQNCLPVPLLPGFKSKVRPAGWRALVDPSCPGDQPTPGPSSPCACRPGWAGRLDFERDGSCREGFASGSHPPEADIL